MVSYCCSPKIWYDQSLRWNPNDYGGIKNLQLPAASIWTPEIVLFNKWVWIDLSMN